MRRGASAQRAPLLALVFAGVFAVVAAANPQSPAPNPQPPATNPQSPAIDVQHYEASIEPDIAARRLTGRVRITFEIRADGVGVVEFDSGSLVVDSVTEDGTARAFEPHPRHTRVSFPALSKVGDRHTIDITYHGTPGRAVQFSSDPPFVVTVFTTSEWMVCVDAPGDKATLDLSVTTPAALVVTASGEEVAHVRQGDRLVTRWREDRPMPTYTFGFAAGEFREAMIATDGVRHRLLGASFSTAELEQLFADSGDIVRFFAARSGVPYAGVTYTQVVAGTGVGQEMSRYALFPESYGRAVVNGDGTASLGVHELAHQWWGNLVTCTDWTHFWLNEGMATFMTAAYAEHRLGRQAYLAQIASSRARYQRVVDAGHDRPLQFPNWNRPSADDRTLVYHKGSYALSRLRELLGDDAFWLGIKRYTQAYAGKSVTSVDFQRAMEQSSGRNLTAFFAEWVF